MLELNQRITSLEPSKSVTLMEKTKKLQKTDSSILNLTGGEPDFDTPAPICEEAYRQMMAGYTHYIDGPGIAELREALAKKLLEENNAPYQAENIIITPGGKFAVFLAVQAVMNPGDEALWLAPGWVSYPSIIQSTGGIPVAVHLKWDEDYRITYEALAAATTEKTKLLIINYPNNPTGKILSESDREVLARYMRDYPNVLLLSDEIYEHIVYDNHQVVSMASYPDLMDRVLVVNGFSKSYAMTGWRLGYLACAPEIYKVAAKLFQHTMSCTSGFLQKAALVALECKDEMEQMRQSYERRGKILYEGLNRLKGVEMMKPEGAFYAWVKFDLDMNSQQACDYLLEQAKIAGVPGAAYGEEDKICVRYSFASKEEHLHKMIENLTALLGEK